MKWIKMDDILINLERLDSIEFDKEDNQILFIYKKGLFYNETILEEKKYKTFDEADQVFSKIKYEIQQENKKLIVI
jgi:hypothetical protein